MDGHATIRVLIVDDYAEARESIARLLSFETDIEVVGQAADGQGALQLARDLRPDVVLMDVNMPGLDGIATTEALAREAPWSQVIMMSVQGEPDYLRRSMLAGARDYLTKPFSGDELANTIRRVHELDAGRKGRQGAPEPAEPVAERRTGRIVCLFSPKGGAGRSVIAVNLAIALRQLTERRVAIVDGSLQFGDVGLMLNLVSRFTIGDLLAGIDELAPETLRNVMVSHSSGIDALLAPQRPEVAELFTAAHVARILEAVRQSYDYVVVDTAATLHETVLSAFDLADQIVLLTTPEMTAIKSARLFLEISQALGYRSDKVLLVLNQAEPASGIQAQDLEASIQRRVAAQLVNAGPLVTASINRGVPFILGEPDSPVARSVRQLARQLAIPEHIADKNGRTGPAGGAIGKLKVPVFGRKGA